MNKLKNLIKNKKYLIWRRFYPLCLLTMIILQSTLIILSFKDKNKDNHLNFNNPIFKIGPIYPGNKNESNLIGDAPEKGKPNESNLVGDNPEKGNPNESNLVGDNPEKGNPDESNLFGDAPEKGNENKGNLVGDNPEKGNNDNLEKHKEYLLKKENNYTFKITSDEINMVENSWASMWFVDFIPFQLRLNLVKAYETIKGKSPKLRNLILGQGEEIKISKNKSYTIYRDRFIAPVWFETFSFFIMNALTDGAGYLIRGLFSKFITKMNKLKQLEQSFIQGQNLIKEDIKIIEELVQNAHLQKIAKLDELKKLQEIDTYWSKQKINIMKEPWKNQLESEKKWQRLDEIDKYRKENGKEIEIILKELNEMLTPYLENLRYTKQKVINALNRFTARTARITEELNQLKNTVSGKLIQYWKTFQEIIPKAFNFVKKKILAFAELIKNKLSFVFNNFYTSRIIRLILGNETFIWLKNHTFDLINKIPPFITKAFNEIKENVINCFNFTYSKTSNYLTVYLSYLTVPFLNNIYSSTILTN